MTASEFQGFEKDGRSDGIAQCTSIAGCGTAWVRSTDAPNRVLDASVSSERAVFYPSSALKWFSDPQA